MPSRGGADLLGSMLGGNSIGGGLLGTLGKAALPMILGSVLGGGRGGGGGGLGGLLGAMLGGGGGGATQMSAAERDEADDEATLLVRAMCNAAKADGQIDKEEVEAIVGRLGEVDEHEAEFVRNELRSPLDLDTFVREVPKELAQQVYAFSLFGMRLDTQQEARYLGAVAQGLRLDPKVCNAIHEKLGAPQIFT